MAFPRSLAGIPAEVPMSQANVIPTVSRWLQSDENDRRQPGASTFPVVSSFC